jgi:hypothetical protein
MPDIPDRLAGAIGSPGGDSPSAYEMKPPAIPARFTQRSARQAGSDGKVRARYRLPSRFDLKRVRGDRAWALVLDEDDVPRVHVLRLTR